jgi:ribose transport system substrate-binding protein
MAGKYFKRALMGISAATALMTAGLGSADAQDKKFKIYLSLSYSGNDWQTEAANIVKALAATPP